MGTKLIFKNGKFEWADPNMVDKQTITPQATPTLGNQLAYVGGKFVAADADYYDSELGKIPDFIKQSASDFKNYGYSSSDDVYNGIVSGVDNYKRTIENAKKYNPQWYENNKVNIDDLFLLMKVFHVSTDSHIWFLPLHIIKINNSYIRIRPSNPSVL